jgi:hypothetical protein
MGQPPERERSASSQPIAGPPVSLASRFVAVRSLSGSIIGSILKQNGFNLPKRLQWHEANQYLFLAPYLAQLSIMVMQYCAINGVLSLFGTVFKLANNTTTDFYSIWPDNNSMAQERLRASFAWGGTNDPAHNLDPDRCLRADLLGIRKQYPSLRAPLPSSL